MKSQLLDYLVECGSLIRLLLGCLHDLLGSTLRVASDFIRRRVTWSLKTFVFTKVQVLQILHIFTISDTTDFNTKFQKSSSLPLFVQHAFTFFNFLANSQFHRFRERCHLHRFCERCQFHRFCEWCHLHRFRERCHSHRFLERYQIHMFCERCHLHRFRERCHLRRFCERCHLHRFL